MKIPVLLFFAFINQAFTQTISIREKTRASNPDISMNLLGGWRHNELGSDNPNGENPNGFFLQESELQFTSDVDAYLRAVAIMAVKKESGEFGIEPEEVFLETLFIPNLTLKMGKFKASLSRHNLLHPHTFPFIDAPLVHETLFGEEGLAEVGLSAATLLPAPWFSELTLQTFTTSNASFFNSSRSRDIALLGKWKNLWDITEASTAELGVAGTYGRNSAAQISSVGAVDLTYKWRPVAGGKYAALIFSNELLFGNLSGFSTNKVSGFASWLQYQFARRWWIQFRHDQMGLFQSDEARQTRESFLLGFFPSEFSGLRFQYSYSNPGHSVALQYNITIGAHPAHEY